MKRHIKYQKWKEFIEDFKKNPYKWYKSQIDDDWEFDEETQLKIVEECIYTKNYEHPIKFIKNPTKQVCLEAVKQDGCAIQYIKNPTKEMCLEAINDYGQSIQFIKNPTEEMYLEAVKQEGGSIQYISKKNQSFDIVQAFFNYNWSESVCNREDYYRYLNEKFITKEQSMIMIKDNPENINLVSEEIQKELLEMKSELRKYLYKENVNSFFE